MDPLRARSVGPVVGIVLGGCALVVACSSNSADIPSSADGGSEASGTSGTSGDGTSGTSGDGTSGVIGDSATFDSHTNGETPCDPVKTDCKAGEVCTSVGRDIPVCRAGCTKESECTTVTSCVFLSAGHGACVATCAPFGADCPMGFTCTAHAPEAPGVSQTSTSAFCRKTGAIALGGPCVDDPLSCGANAECLFFPDKGEGIPDSVCHSLCDQGHPCSGGKGMCVMKGSETFGFCDGG